MSYRTQMVAMCSIEEMLLSSATGGRFMTTYPRRQGGQRRFNSAQLELRLNGLTNLFGSPSARGALGEYITDAALLVDEAFGGACGCHSVPNSSGFSLSSSASCGWRVSEISVWRRVESRRSGVW